MTTAIFSVVQAVLLRPVPFPDSERLVMMWETDRNSGTTREPASLPDFVDYRQRSRQVDRVGAFVSADLNLVPDHGDPRRLAALATTPELLQILGVQTVAGRSFSAEEDRPHGPRVAMINDRLWDQLFARDPSAIGRPIRLDGIPVTMETHGEMNHRPGATLSAGSQTVLPTIRFSPATTVEFTAAANSSRRALDSASVAVRGSIRSALQKS